MTVDYSVSSSFYANGAQSQRGVRVAASDTLEGARLLATTLEGQKAVMATFDLVRIGTAPQLTPDLVDTLFLADGTQSVPAVGGY